MPRKPSITQPTLSRSIAALEGLVEVRLFDRTQKGVTPTPYGRILLDRGEAVLMREFDLRREIRLLAGLEEGSLTISAGPYLAETTVATAIARVSLAHPHLKIHCATADPADVARDVLEERIDVGVATTGGLETEERLAVEPLPVQRIYFACRPGHPLAGEPTLTLKRVFEFPLVTTLLRGEHAALAMSAGLVPGVFRRGANDFAPQIYVTSAVLGRLVARESNAVFPGTASMLAADIADGRLVALDFDAPAMRTSGGIIYLKNRTLAPAAVAFIEALRQAESEAQAASPVKTSPRLRPRSRRKRTA